MGLLLPQCGQVPDEHGGIAVARGEAAAVGEEGQRSDAAAKAVGAVTLFAASGFKDMKRVGSRGGGGEAAAVGRKGHGARHWPRQSDSDGLAGIPLAEKYVV